MLTFVAIAFLLGATIAAPVEDPNTSPCCTPKQWSGTMGSMVDSVSDGKLSTTNQTMMFYYDYNNKKTATVGKGFRVVGDYNKMVAYNIASGTCTTSKLTEPILNCVPTKAIFLGSYQYGGPQGVKVNEYSVDAFAPNIKGRISYTADGCIPVRETVVITGANASAYSLDFIDIALSIKDPSIFDVPSPPCPKDTDLDNVVDVPMPRGSTFARLP
ncbi:ependymin-related protein 1-like [Branchiostoma lanceolatum]|uniref:ependymin-related protein 1-like n=1 Tax=Branchiostoma lanceolatum TaxID=7740 RepID=UPI003455C3AA